MVVKVYGSVKSACTQRVMACLFEKEVQFELVHVNLETGEHKQSEFLARQPFGQVPAVEDGEFKLFESRAIIRYYAAKYASQGTNLLGNTLEHQALIDQWLDVEAHNYNDLVYNLVLQCIVLPKMGKPSDLAKVNDCEHKMERVLDVYEQRLSQSKYLAGDLFTLADLSHIPGTKYLTHELGLERLVKERKNVSAWWEDISSRKAWRKVVKLAC
ncbi:hypothetical protein Scep_016079 [Stephania cephalantha]|uniref:glutathione transferase n=1 Tax=Stephania cephalantha TaxID=152367 RepID=A0AAP0NVG1_9MAGN